MKNKKRVIKNIAWILFLSLIITGNIYNYSFSRAAEKIEIEQPEPVIGMEAPEMVPFNPIKNHESAQSEKANNIVSETTIEASRTPAPFSDNLQKILQDHKDFQETSTEESDDSLSITKHYNNEKDFEPGVVLVGLKNTGSKSSILSDAFSDIETEKIVDQDELLVEAIKGSNSKVKNKSDVRSIDYERIYSSRDFVINLTEKSKSAVLDTIKELEQNENVVYAMPNYYYSPCETTPNDYNSSQQWNLEKIGMPDAWSEETGSVTCSVGILDTGIDNEHPDLASNINMSLAYNANNQNSLDSMDIYGHGTGVAGIIGAKGNNLIGISGINWNVSMVPIKICLNNSENASVDAMVEAINYAINNNIDICNLSYGMPDYPAFIEAIEQYQGLLVIAAGNDGSNIDNLAPYPELSSLDNVIIVSSTYYGEGDNENRVNTSNYGINTATIAAPGSHIYTTNINDGYIHRYGTSFAAPHVTGVAALIKSKYPDLTAAQIKERIMNGVDFLPKLSGLVSSGRLNANYAINNTSNPQCLFVEPDNGENMSSAITRSLGTKDASSITRLKVIGNGNMGNCTNDSVSANSVLPNIEQVDLSSFNGELGKYSFYGCSKLTTVYLPEKDFQLPAFCFMNCTSLNTVYRANDCTRIIGEGDFTGLLGIVDATYPFAIQTQCFQNCTSLSTICLPNTIKLRISMYAFNECSNLDTIYIDSQEKETGVADLTEFSQIYNGVLRATSISAVKLPKDIEVMGCAFENCSELTNIQVYPAQNQKNTIANDAFYNVNSDCKVYMNQILYNDNTYIFNRTSTLSIPKEVNSLIITPNDNERINYAILRYLDDVVAINIKNLVLIGNASMSNSYNFRESASIVLNNLEMVDLSLFNGSLGTEAFANCTKLKYIIRNENFQYIPSRCFYGCTILDTIIVDNKYPKNWHEADLSDLVGLLAVDTEAFASCSSLEVIRFPYDDGTVVASDIGISGAFTNCTNLKTIYRTEKVVGEFDLTGISSFWPGWGYNFAYTRASSVKLPKEVVISEYCFYDNTNKYLLLNIYFDKTQTQAYYIGEKAFYGANARCKAYMSSALFYNNNFILPRHDSYNITKVLYD